MRVWLRIIIKVIFGWLGSKEKTKNAHFFPLMQQNLNLNINLNSYIPENHDNHENDNFIKEDQHQPDPHTDPHTTPKNLPNIKNDSIDRILNSKSNSNFISNTELRPFSTVLNQSKGIEITQNQKVNNQSGSFGFNSLLNSVEREDPNFVREIISSERVERGGGFYDCER